MLLSMPVTGKMQYHTMFFWPQDNFYPHPQVVIKADYQKYTDRDNNRFDLGLGYALQHGLLEVGCGHLEGGGDGAAVQAQDLDLAGAPFAVVVLVGGDPHFGPGRNGHGRLLLALPGRDAFGIDHLGAADANPAHLPVGALQVHPAGRDLRPMNDDAAKRSRRAGPQGSRNQQSGSENRQRELTHAEFDAPGGRTGYGKKAVSSQLSAKAGLATS